MLDTNTRLRLTIVMLLLCAAARGELRADDTGLGYYRVGYTETEIVHAGSAGQVRQIRVDLALAARCAGGVVSLAVACRAGGASTQSLPVCVEVRLVNDIAIEAGTLGAAKELVTRVFVDAGVELVWAGKRSTASAPD